MSPFELVTRHQIRFPTSKGLLSIEDLWTLPLSSAVGKPNLNDIAKDLDRQINEGQERSFVKNDASKKANPLVKAAFDAVLRIIEVREAENADALESRAKAEKKQLLLQLLQDKQHEELKGKSADELRAMIDAL